MLGEKGIRERIEEIDHLLDFASWLTDEDRKMLAGIRQGLAWALDMTDEQWNAHRDLIVPRVTGWNPSTRQIVLHRPVDHFDLKG